ncbi:hypothetical protein BB559_007173 [Furculomyces boomerangus]|uniref:Arb2 domain-containing protein n=2 Tax=Harpellales TaxID=61421 RepID=A0A2T9XYP5_9FUNG|nr:hypothetical protein BB559_007173 [Furculomyces boomerangus]PVZ99926.1 hypothetical protein BB558_004046 [Smittium angustum]
MFVRRVKNLNSNTKTSIPTIEELGYELTSHGLRHPQRAAISKKTIQIIKNRLGLLECKIPFKNSKIYPGCPIFHTKNAFESKKLVLIATGVNSGPGLWEPSSVAKYGFENGSIILLLEKLISNGYDFILLNPNENSIDQNGVSVTSHSYNRNNKTIIESNSPESHFDYVWLNAIIKKSKADNIVFITSEYCGFGVLDLLNNHYDDFCSRVCGAVFLESSHTTFGLTPESLAWLKLCSVNLKRSSRADDTSKFDSSLGCMSYPINIAQSESNATDHDVETKGFRHVGVILSSEIVKFVESSFEKGLVGQEVLMETAEEILLELEISNLSINEPVYENNPEWSWET